MVARLLMTLVVLGLPGIASGQRIRPVGERPQLPIASELTSDVPSFLAEDAALTFVKLDKYFDGGSYGAEFRRGDRERLVIFFPHRGYWTKQAIEDAIQPIAVISSREKKQILVEIERGSLFEQRVIELLDADLASNPRDRVETHTLEKIRDCVQNRKPLRVKRFAGGFRASQ